jgi:hypothetical protein
MKIRSKANADGKNEEIPNPFFKTSNIYQQIPTQYAVSA